MALIIRTDGTVQEVEPANGRYFTREELQHTVGGQIEVIELNEYDLMICNSEKQRALGNMNDKATARAHENNAIGCDEVIRGDVFICLQSPEEYAGEDRLLRPYIKYYARMDCVRAGMQIPGYVITAEAGYYPPMSRLKGMNGKISMYLKENKSNSPLKIILENEVRSVLDAYNVYVGVSIQNNDKLPIEKFIEELKAAKVFYVKDDYTRLKDELVKAANNVPFIRLPVVPFMRLQAKNKLFSDLKCYYMDGKPSGYAYGYPPQDATYDKKEKKDPLYKFKVPGFLFVFNYDGNLKDKKGKIIPSSIELIVLKGAKWRIEYFYEQLVSGGFDEILDSLRRVVKEASPIWLWEFWNRPAGDC